MLPILIYLGSILSLKQEEETEDLVSNSLVTAQIIPIKYFIYSEK